MLNKLFKIVLLTILILATFITIPIYDSTVNATVLNNTGIINTSFANVYKGPGQRFGLTGSQMFRGQLVTTHQSENGWTYVEGESTAGWIWGDFINYSNGVGVLTSSFANLYNGSAISSGIKGQILQGTTVVLFNERNGWRQVFVNNEEAWVWGEFLDKIQGVGTISSSFANLYHGAALSTGTKGRVDRGTTVLYSEIRNGWRKSYVEGQEAWIWDQNLNKNNINKITSETITNSSHVNIYNSAALAHGTKGQFFNGNRVIVFTTLNGWKYVQSRDKEGWIWGTFSAPTISTAQIINSSFVNIYNGAASSSGTKGRLNQNTVVTINEQVNGWRNIRSGDTTGWVWGEFIKEERHAPSFPQGIAKTRYGLNVYQGPGSSYSTSGNIARGSQTATYQAVNGWRYVHAGHIQGWVWDAYLITELEETLSNITIVLDPGHGGSDPGAVNTQYGIQEKNVVLDIGNRTKALLDKTPFNIKMTRSTDSNNLTANGTTRTTTDSAYLRAQFARDNKTSDNDVFISLHNNSFDKPTASGGETFYWSGTSPHTAESQILAESIQNQMIRNMQITNRGVKTANFIVLRESLMPSVLVEIGFISNPSDAQKLADPVWRQRAAVAIYNGILDYYEAKGFDVRQYR